MADAQIIPIFATRSSASPATDSTSNQQPQSRVVTAAGGNDSSSSPKPPLTLNDLYPDLDGGQSILASALSLLGEAETKLTEAAGWADVDEQISADDAVQRFQALLPELFCCRSLGDSFATVIHALFQGLKNLNGAPVNKDQIAQLLNSVRILRRRPFLEYGEALSAVARLEAAGLRVDPQGLTTIGEALLG
jgi:hypothetical protein